MIFSNFNLKIFAIRHFCTSYVLVRRRVSRSCAQKIFRRMRSKPCRKGALFENCLFLKNGKVADVFHPFYQTLVVSEL